MITADRDVMEEAIKQSQKVTPRNGHLPILHHVRFMVQRTRMTIEATDLEIGISCAIEIRNSDMLDTKQTFCLNAEHVWNAIKALPRDVSEVPIAVAENEVTVGSISLVRTDPGEFPKLPELPAGAIHEYPLPGDFAELAKKVIPAVSKEAVKYTLTGVYCDFKRGMLVSSDGKRLHTVKLGAGKRMPGLLLPQRCLTTADAIAIVAEKRKKKAVEMAFLVTNNGYVSAKVIEGTFPDYTQVIPKANGRLLQTFRDPLHKMLTELFTINKERCTLSLDGAVILSAEKSDVGVYRKVVPGAYKGENLTISVNPSFLADAVGAVTSDNVTISFNNAETAIVIGGENDPFNAVVMPLRC